MVPALTALWSTLLAAFCIAVLTALSLTFCCVSRSVNDFPERSAVCRLAVLMCSAEAAALSSAVVSDCIRAPLPLKPPLPPQATNRSEALAGIDARLHGVGLLLGDLAVLQHLVDGLELCLLEGVGGLRGHQVQDPGQLVDKYLGVVLRGGWRRRWRGRRFPGRHADDHGSQPGRRQHDPTIQLHT